VGDREVLVYYTPGCPYWTALRVKLVLARIPFRAIRFRDDEDGAAAVRAVNDGNEMSPTVRIGEEWLTNPSLARVRAVLAQP
jgi:mycoredoxin